MQLAVAVPCALCKRPIADTAQGQGFKLGKLVFVTCLDCAPHVRATAKLTGEALRTGLSALLTTKFPQLTPILQQVRAAYAEAQRESHHEP